MSYKGSLPLKGDLSNPHREEVKQSLLSRNNSTEFTSGTATYIRGGCCQNLKELFCYIAPTQDDLRAFLFSTSERYSTFLAKEDHK
jgi:hypothetical protein